MKPPEPTDRPGVDTSLVECIVVVVPEMGSFESVTSELAELVRTAAIRILDLVVVTRRHSDHEISVLEMDALENFPASVLNAEAIGELLSKNDIALAATGVLPGAVALILLVEDRWAGSLSLAAKRAGGRVVGGERIPRARIEAALAPAPREPDIGFLAREAPTNS